MDEWQEVERTCAIPVPGSMAKLKGGDIGEVVQKGRCEVGRRSSGETDGDTEGVVRKLKRWDG